MTGWPHAQVGAFLASQFDLQSAHYADAVFSVVEDDGEPIGRLIVSTGPDEVRIVDAALVPAVRGRGIGSDLIRGVMAAAAGRRVTIHVEALNPAMRLYERLGFRPVEAHGVYWLMEARPEEIVRR